jgi:CheY-like chemotaxis protein
VVDRRALKVLLVEDDSSMVSMLRAILENEGYQDIRVVESGAEALDPAAASDIVLLDNQLPDGTGIDLLPRLLAQPDPPSVIMVTGEGSEELAANAMRLGAEDYLVKGPPASRGAAEPGGTRPPEPPAPLHQGRGRTGPSARRAARSHRRNDRHAAP